MKKIIIITILLVCWVVDMDAQRIVVNGKVPKKGLNAPKNYFGYRPEYNDTLYIDFGQGQKMEIIYRWFDLFRDSDEKFQKYFWLPYQTKYSLLKEKIEELPLEEHTKYVISIVEKTDASNYKLENAFHYNDKEAIAQIRKEKYGDINKKYVQYFQGADSLRTDSALSQMMDDFFMGNYPKESVISMTERKQDLEHREYRLQGDKLVGQAQWQHIVEINNRQWKVRLYVNDPYDLSAFESVDLRQFFRSEKHNFLRKKYYMSHTVLHYKLDNSEIKYQYQPGERKQSRSRYMNIRWSPIVGTSLTNGQWSADLGAQVGLTFNDKQQYANRVGIRCVLKGITQEFDWGSRFKHYGFVDAIWDVNLADDYQREQWVGAGFGYLVYNGGNAYGDNTARLFLKYRSSQLWGIQPEFNYSIDDNNGFIGLGFFFSF